MSGNENKGWKFYNNKAYPVTYAVYNKCGEKTSEITGGCGHQMKVFSAPILDVDTSKFIKYSEMLVKEIEFLMTAVFDPNATNDIPLFYAKKRWINALQIFNTAYEQASINRYDATLISLVSILESLFLKKNTYNKKKRLIFYISEFLDKNCREIINKSYKKRSAFVHEGIRFGEIHPYKLAEIPHNYIPGFRPFTDYSFLAYPQKVNEIKQLMQLCSRIILKMIKDNNFMIGQYKIKPSSKTDISYNSIKKEVLSHLIILDDDIDTFNYYLDIRGIGTYYDAIKNLMIYTENEKIEFNDFMGFIRYDKNLKDVLYKMLGSFEENLKENIYNHFDYIGEKPFSKITDQNIHLFVKLKPTGGFGWNLYRNSRLELGSMIHLINSNDHVIETKSDNYLEDLNNIKDLRNLVMHHKMLLVDQSKEPKSKAQIENRISNVLDGIISLYKLLPSDYDKGLISAINKANYDSKRNTVKSKYIYIRHLEGGY
ncbi:MAG: hypothetical protein ACOCQD_03170, partial [archaeon]